MSPASIPPKPPPGTTTPPGRKESNHEQASPRGGGLQPPNPHPLVARASRPQPLPFRWSHLPATAQLDTQGSGMSDVWQRHFNRDNPGQLFNPENPAHAPHADPDGDGWTNLEESFAGTDPFSGIPPEGLVVSHVTHLKDQEETPTPEYPDGRLIDVEVISWDTLPGKSYTLHYSPDLTNQSWLPVDLPYYGDGQPAATSITLTDSGGISPDRLFWRVAVEDVDNDNDGLTDHEEFLLGSNPYAADTSGDGIPDKWLVVHGLNPNQHHANILFPNSDITAVDAFAIGVQDHPDANPEDLDGDGLANEIDAHPEDRQINWERASVSAYALIDLGWPESSQPGYLGSIVDFNDVGHVLLKDAVWVDGHWHPIEHQEVSGNAAWWGVDYTYQSEFNIGSSLMPDGGMIQAGEWTASGGPSDVMSVWHVGYMPYDQTTSGHGAFISTLSTLGPFINDKEISITPMGGDRSGRIFGRKSWYDLEYEICILNQNLEQIGAMEFPDNMRPSWTNRRVTPSGWVAVSAIATSQSQSHQTLVWNPDGIITSYENGHLPFYFQDIADLPNGNVALTYHQPVAGDQVFLVSNATGSFSQSVSLSGKEILAFAGNGTAITADHKIWINGELVPIADLCSTYQDMRDDGWNLFPFHGNKNGTFLIGGTRDDDVVIVKLVITSLIADLNNDGAINGKDIILSKASFADSAVELVIDAGTEFIFHNDRMSNGIWDREDNDEQRPENQNEDDDAHEISLTADIQHGEAWLTHPAIHGISFYVTKECTPEGKRNIHPNNKFIITPDNPLPKKLFIRADGNINYPENNPQIEGELTLMIRGDDATEPSAGAKLRLTIVNGVGAKKYFHAARDYIFENNTRMFVRREIVEQGSHKIQKRIITMLHEKAEMKAIDTFHRDPKLYGIDAVAAAYPDFDVVVNGNFCFYSSLFRNRPGRNKMTDKCHGRLITNGNVHAASSTDGNHIFESAQADYIGWNPGSGINIKTGIVPINPLQYQEALGGFGSNLLAEGSWHPWFGIANAGENKVFFVAMPFVVDASGNGGRLDLRQKLLNSGCPPLPGGKPGEIQCIYGDGGTSLGLAYRIHSSEFITRTKGSKHVRNDARFLREGGDYYINTYLSFKSNNPR